MMKEVKEAFCFVCSSECWRMVLFWSIALVSSYLQLLRARVFGSKATPISCSINPHNGSSRPICVITGVSEVLFTWKFAYNNGSKIYYYSCYFTGWVNHCLDYVML